MSKELSYKSNDELPLNGEIILLNKGTNDVSLVLSGKVRSVSILLNTIEDLVLNYNVPINDLIVITGTLVFEPYFPGVNAATITGGTHCNEPQLKLVC